MIPGASVDAAKYGWTSSLPHESDGLMNGAPLVSSGFDASMLSALPADGVARPEVALDLRRLVAHEVVARDDAGSRIEDAVAGVERVELARDLRRRLDEATAGELRQVELATEPRDRRAGRVRVVGERVAEELRREECVAAREAVRS